MSGKCMHGKQNNKQNSFIGRHSLNLELGLGSKHMHIGLQTVWWKHWVTDTVQ